MQRCIDNIVTKGPIVTKVNRINTQQVQSYLKVDKSVPNKTVFADGTFIDQNHELGLGFTIGFFGRSVSTKLFSG